MFIFKNICCKYILTNKNVILSRTIIKRLAVFLMTNFHTIRQDTCLKSSILRSMIFFATFKTLSAISIFIAEKLGLDIKIRPCF